MKRTLTALTVLVAALAVLVVVDAPRGRRAAPLADRILEGFSPDHVLRLAIHAPGRPDVVLTRRDKVLELTAPAPYPTDEAAVRDLLGTLEYLAARRRLPAASGRGLEEPRLRLEVTSDDGATVDLRVGKEEPALGRTWVARSDRAAAYLVDDFAAAALDRGVDDLRRRDPLPGAGEARAITLQAGAARVVLRGAPLCVELAGGCARADARRVEELTARLSDLRVSRFAGWTAHQPEVALQVTVDGASLTVGGDCPGGGDERLALSRLGPACLAAESVDGLAREVSAPETWVDRGLFSLAPGSIERVEASGLTLVKKDGAWSLAGGGKVDEEAVTSWLDELTGLQAKALAPAVAAAAPPAGALVLSVSGGGKGEVVWLAGELVQRPGEPVALRFEPGLRRLLAPEPAELADRRLLSFDAYALAAVEYEGEGGPETAARGGTADDWRLSVPIATPADAGVIAALRDAASELRARRVAAASARPEHGLSPPRRRVAFVVDPPPTAAAGAPPVRVGLELGARSTEGCFARRSGAETVYLLAPETCAAIDVHLAAREAFQLEGELESVSIGAARLDRRGPTWFQADGTRLDARQAANLAAAVGALETAPAVAGYGSLSAGTHVVITTSRGKVALDVAGGQYAVEGRPVRYQLPPAACTRWPALCVYSHLPH